MEQLKKLFEKTKQKQTRKGMLGSLVTMATIVFGGLVVAIVAATVAHGLYSVIGVSAPNALAMIFMYAVIYTMAYVFVPILTPFLISAIAIQLFLTILVYVFAMGIGAGATYILMR